jgi:hypothetical protein
LRASFGFHPAVAQVLGETRNQIRTSRFCDSSLRHGVSTKMNGIIYLVGLVVVILAILSFFGLR